MTSPAAPLPWQLEAWGQLTRQLESDRLPHALLLVGPAGIGKQHLARAFVARMLCAAPVSGTACGDCKPCNLLAAGSHPDLMEISPEEGSRVIKIDQVRALIEFAGKTPAIGTRKCALLGPAEAMNINAANALLKCLEEPSASTTLLLYSHQPTGLPATVRSRCQTLALVMPLPDECAAWLSRVCGNEETARALMAVTDGRPLVAQALFEKDGLQAMQAVLAGLASLVEGRLSPLEFPALVSELDLVQVLGLMQRTLEHELRAQLALGNTAVQPAFRLRDELARLQMAVSDGANPNRQLIIEDYSARLASSLRAACT
jgi:DNA polymerase-3 subunit delta'